MRRSLSVILSVLLSFCCVFFSTQATAEFKKTKIAVLDFELRGDSFKTEDMGGIVAEWFTTSLVQDGRFEVVERALLNKIIQEQKLGMTGIIDQSSSSQLGKILGVKTIITGSVLQVEDTIEVNARIINVQTGSIVAAENIRSDSSKKLKDLIEQITTKIVRNFPLTGYVVRRDVDEVLIDLGDSSGLQEGMEFVVFTEGEVIKHPKTGEVLEIEQVPTGKVMITEIGANISHGRIVEELGEIGVKYGQLVQSVRKPQSLSPTATSEMQPTSANNTGKSQKDQKSFGAEGYIRSELAEGQRDMLASGGEGPPLLALSTGRYMMGSDRFSEKPMHFVSIEKPVLMMSTEVTFADYDKYCLETSTTFPEDNGWGRNEMPVINVSYEDAKAYAAWLSKQTGYTYRLPYENEWEWAAGGGLGLLYTWGSDFETGKANCRDCFQDSALQRSQPVRSYPPNKSAFYDMGGNVWEWVEDCWAEHYNNAPENQAARSYTGTCANYTVRGGGWNSSKNQITVTTRLGVWEGTKSNYIGFRLIRDSKVVVLDQVADDKKEITPDGRNTSKEIMTEVETKTQRTQSKHLKLPAGNKEK